MRGFLPRTSFPQKPVIVAKASLTHTTVPSRSVITMAFAAASRAADCNPNCLSALLRPVISRAMPDIPVIFPASSLIGDTETETPTPVDSVAPDGSAREEGASHGDQARR